MIKTVEKFCSEKRLRFGYGFESGLNDFFSMDSNGVYVIIGRPKVGVTEGDVVMRGNAVQYRDELAAMLGRNGNKVSRSDNRLHVVFRIARPMSSGGTGYQPTPPTPPTPSVTPLYFEAKQTNSTVSMMSAVTTAPSLEYSEDGATWQTWAYTDQEINGEQTHVYDTITLGAVGDKVYFRGINASFSDINGGYKMSMFSVTGDLKVGGSVQSLVDGTGESTTAIEMAGLFAASASITEVEENLLPATTLTDYCYLYLFMNSGIVASPILPAETLAEHCYEGMFWKAASLAEVTCLATDISATDCVNAWLDETAASGTLYKAAAMTGWVEGTNYPSGWTLTDYAG